MKQTVHKYVLGIVFTQHCKHVSFSALFMQRLFSFTQPTIIVLSAKQKENIQFVTVALCSTPVQTLSLAQII